MSRPTRYKNLKYQTKPIKYEQFSMDMTGTRMSINRVHDPTLNSQYQYEKQVQLEIGIEQFHRV